MQGLLDTDEELIQNIRNGCSESFKEISERHSGTVMNVLKKFLPKMIEFGYYKFDLMSDKDIILHKAAQNFDVGKGSKYSTWATNQARYFCLNFFKKRRKSVDDLNVENLECPEFYEQGLPESSYDPYEYINVSDNVSTAMRCVERIKSKKRRRILKLRLLENASWNNISKTVGEPVSRVKSIYYYEIKKIKNHLTFDKNRAL